MELVSVWHLLLSRLVSSCPLVAAMHNSSRPRSLSLIVDFYCPLPSPLVLTSLSRFTPHHLILTSSPASLHYGSLSFLSSAFRSSVAFRLLLPFFFHVLRLSIHTSSCSVADNEWACKECWKEMAYESADELVSISFVSIFLNVCACLQSVGILHSWLSLRQVFENVWKCAASRTVNPPLWGRLKYHSYY